jgi:FtsZ-binding cell division protein ZapB
MGIEALITAIIALGGTIGGFVGGKKMSASASVDLAVSTVDLLQIQVQTLKNDGVTKDAVVTDLRARVELLEQLVTQRARVEEVYNLAEGIRSVVDRIEGKIDGHPGE